MNVATPKKSKGLTPVEPLQMSQINLGTFSIKGITERADVLAPLVSVELQEEDKVINIKIAVFIPTPLLGRPALELFLDSDAPDNEIQLLLQYRSSETDPSEYHAWYICYTHILSEGTEKIENVSTFLENLGRADENPRTKRGTVTQVLRS